jgi:hypothetical protein
MLKTFIIILTVTLLSCTNSGNSTNTSTVDTKKTVSKETSPAIDTFATKELSFNKDNEQGWGADIRLSFTHSRPADKGIIYKVNSSYKNKIIGFEITVPNPGLSKLTIKSVGANSNNFIHVLSKLYKQKLDTTLHFTDLITADCMNMGDYIDSLNKQADANYVSTKSQYKLFFQGKNEDDYAELYLNVNEKEHWIELEEKDEEYRPILIKLLTHK